MNVPCMRELIRDRDLSWMNSNPWEYKPWARKKSPKIWFEYQPGKVLLHMIINGSEYCVGGNMIRGRTYQDLRKKLMKSILMTIQAKYSLNNLKNTIRSYGLCGYEDVL